MRNSMIKISAMTHHLNKLMLVLLLQMIESIREWNHGLRVSAIIVVIIVVVDVIVIDDVIVIVIVDVIVIVIDDAIVAAERINGAIPPIIISQHDRARAGFHRTPHLLIQIHEDLAISGTRRSTFPLQSHHSPLGGFGQSDEDGRSRRRRR